MKTTNVNSPKKSILKRTNSKRETKFAPDESFRQVFWEQKYDYYSSNVQSKIKSINKTFMFPEMVDKLTSNDAEIRLKAIKKLIEWFKTESITSGKYSLTEIIDNSTDLLFKIRKNKIKVSDEEEEQVIQLLALLSKKQKCSSMMGLKVLFVKELYKILYNVQSANQEQVAIILHNMTANSSDFVPVFVKTNKPFAELTKIFNRPTCVLFFPTHLWLHLANLIEAYPHLGVKYGFFELCYNRIKTKMTGFHLEVMAVLTALMSCKKGLERFEKSDIMEILLDIITNFPKDALNFEYILNCFNKAFESEVLKLRCEAYPELPLELIDIARKTTNADLQLACVIAIRNIYAIPVFRSTIYNKCLGALKKLKAGSLVEYVVQEFVTFVKLYHKIYKM